MRAVVWAIGGATAVYLAGSFFALDLSWIGEHGGDQAIGRVFIVAGGLWGLLAATRS